MADKHRVDVLWGVVMNPNYNQTITIYNCLRAQDNPGSKKDIWQRTVLHDCFYKNVIGQVESGNSIKMANVYTARIPESPMYVPYAEWIILPENIRKNRFTFRLDDIIVKGECREEITGTSPNTASELLSRHKPDAFKVTAFSDNTSHRYGKHYRVGG